MSCVARLHLIAVRFACSAIVCFSMQTSSALLWPNDSRFVIAKSQKTLQENGINFPLVMFFHFFKWIMMSYICEVADFVSRKNYAIQRLWLPVKTAGTASVAVQAAIVTNKNVERLKESTKSSACILLVKSGLKTWKKQDDHNFETILIKIELKRPLKTVRSHTNNTSINLIYRTKQRLIAFPIEVSCINFRSSLTNSIPLLIQKQSFGAEP